MAGRSGPILWSLLGVLAVAVCAAALYRAWPMLHPPGVVRAPLNPGCDLRQGPCSVTFGQGATVTLAITPGHLPPLVPLRFVVDQQGLEVTGPVVVDIVGLNMNMGFNRPELAPDGPGRWTGEVRIPVCTLSRMDWEALVLLPSPQGLRGAPFHFSTYRADAGRTSP